MELTYFGHSCFLIDCNGSKLLFDPFISQNPKAKSVDIEDIKTDYVLLSHGHADHTADAVQICKQNNATLVANYEVINWFEKQGIEKSISLNYGGKISMPFGYIKMVNAVHSSSMPDGSYGGNPAGFIVSADKNFYFSGDTALHYDMKLLGEMHKLDFAIMCIGDHFTMGVDDALIASDFVGVDHIYGAHFDTFPAISIDHKLAINKASKKNKQLELLEIGQKIIL